jgi:hypothetical protein
VPTHVIDEMDAEVFEGGKCGQAMDEIDGKFFGVDDGVIEVPREHEALTKNFT